MFKSVTAMEISCDITRRDLHIHTHTYKAIYS